MASTHQLPEREPEAAPPARRKYRLSNPDIPGVFTAPWWRVVLAGVAILALGALVIALSAELLRIIFLVVLAASIAGGLAPPVAFLDRFMPRTLAVILIFLGILLLFGMILWIILPTIFEQGGQFIAQIPGLFTQLQELYQEVGDAEINLVPLFESLANQVGQVGSAILALPVGLASGLVEVVLLLFLSLYMLLEAPRMRKSLLSLYPKSRRERVNDVSEKIAEAMGGFVRGTVIISVVVAVLVYIGLLIIGVRFALVLALIAGLLEFLPYIGPFLAAIPMVLVALLDSPTKALIVFAFFVIIQELESNILVPNIQRTQTEISPLQAILALTAGGILGGLIGILAAIPLAAALRVFTTEVIAPEIRRRTGAAEDELLDSKDEPDEAG